MVNYHLLFGIINNLLLDWEGNKKIYLRAMPSGNMISQCITIFQIYTNIDIHVYQYTPYIKFLQVLLFMYGKITIILNLFEQTPV